MLKEYGLDKGWIVATLADGYLNLTTREAGEEATDINLYQRILRKLNWLVQACRPDIAFVVLKLS